MEKIYIGKIVNTHGIKGEIRLLSDFPYKDKVFYIGNKVIIDNKEYIINSYRHHKIFDMLTLKDYNSINDVLFLMNKKVYVDKSSIKLSNNEILDEDLITYKVLTNTKEEGYITEIFMASKSNKVLRIMLKKEVLVPYNSPMLEKIDKENKTIYINLIEGM